MRNCRASLSHNPKAGYANSYRKLKNHACVGVSAYRCIGVSVHGRVGENEMPGTATEDSRRKTEDGRL
jgi:hypothetical protein